MTTAAQVTTPPVTHDAAGHNEPPPRAPDTAANDGDLSPSTSDSEVAGIRAYYTALIAAARLSLSPAAAAALVKRLRTEKIVATRAAKDRRRAERANLRGARKPAQQSIAAVYPKSQFG